MMQKLKQYYGELCDLRAVLALLEWDQQVFMPKDAAEGRSGQAAALETVIHQKATSPELEDLLGQAAEADYPPDSDEYAFLRLLKRDFDKQRRISPELAGALTESAMRTQAIWEEAKQKSDFSIVRQALSEQLKLKKEYAACFPEFENPYDALLDDYEEGLTRNELDRVFGILKQELRRILRKIQEQPLPDDSFMHAEYPADLQMQFSREVLSAMGYNWNQGRLDLTEHPFTENFGLNDVRITTHVYEHLLPSALFSCIHEGGHALYEQNIRKEYNRTPMGAGISMAFHESQSRFWENLVGKSEPFWQYCFPLAQEIFPANLKQVPFDSFFRAIKRVQPDFIRTEADEVTYNLHIILRYELEKQLIDGSLAVSDLPEAWRRKSAELLGIVPPDDAAGVLQDVHWYCGSIGYFPTYAIGNLISGQFYALIRKKAPEALESVRHGDFKPLLDFLRTNLYQYGAKYSPKAMMIRLFGKAEINPEDWLVCIRERYLS